MIEVYIDGSSKGNPGPGGAGIVIQDKAAQETIGIHGIPLGHVTNNQAEFLALKHALIELKNQRLSDEPVNILTDSQLVVGIFSQNWKARGNLGLSEADLQLRQGAQWIIEEGNFFGIGLIIFGSQLKKLTNRGASR